MFKKKGKPITKRFLLLWIVSLKHCCELQIEIQHAVDAISTDKSQQNLRDMIRVYIYVRNITATTFYDLLNVSFFHVLRLFLNTL
jgi:hypothetical protein